MDIIEAESEGYRDRYELFSNFSWQECQNSSGHDSPALMSLLNWYLAIAAPHTVFTSSSNWGGYNAHGCRAVSRMVGNDESSLLHALVLSCFVCLFSRRPVHCGDESLDDGARRNYNRPGSPRERRNS